MREKHAISDHLPKVAYDGKISIGNKELSCRKYRLHQGLTRETGYQHLTQQISTVTTMMRGFDTWEEFEPVFRKAFGVPDEEKISRTEK